MSPTINPRLRRARLSRRRTRRAASLVLWLVLGVAAGASLDLGSPASAAEPAGAASIGLPTTVSTPALPTVSLPSVPVTTATIPPVNVPTTTLTTPTVPSVSIPTTTVTTPSVPQATVPSTRALSPESGAPPGSVRAATAAPARQNTGPSARRTRPAPPRSLGTSPAHTARRAITSGRRTQRSAHAAARSHGSLPHAAAPSLSVARRTARSAPSLPDLIGRYLPFPLPVPDWSKPIILALLLLCVGLGLRARMTSRRARRLEHSQQALNEDIGAMQSALVPEIPSRLGGLALSVAYRPAEGPAAGGDFYDAFELADERVVIILGDVSGHGRAALAHAARMRYTVRAYAEAGLAPREVLKLAGRTIGRSGDGLYTTVVVAVHDASARSLTYASAGHPPPLFLGQPVHEPLTNCASPPLGWGIPSGRRQTTVPFPYGVRACLFSDGLIEARADHTLLGRYRLARMFAALGSRPSARTLLDRVRDFSSQVRDDMAACIFQAADGAGGAFNETWLEELELDLDQLNLGQGHRFLTACGLSIPEIGLAMTRTRAIVADYGTAVMTVTLPERSCTVTPPPTSTIAPATALPLNAVRMPRRHPSLAS